MTRLADFSGDTQLTSYFFDNSKQIQAVVEAFNQTPLGQRIRAAIPESLDQFNSLPITAPSVLREDPNHVYLPGERELAFRTSGTTGERKTVYIPESTRTIPFAPSIEKVLRQTQAVFLHSARAEDEFFYWVHSVTHADRYPTGIFLQYSDIEGVVYALERSDVFCIYDYPSALQRFLFFVEEARRQGAFQSHDLAHKQLIVDLAGEPMDPDGLAKTRSRVEALFGLAPTICLSYGTTEVGSVGAKDEWVPGEPVEYAVGKGVFVEVLDERSGRNTVGRPGRVIVTALRMSGTIALRYDTGDLGILKFSNNEPTLAVLGKKPSLGAVYVAGSQFYLPALGSELLRRFGIPIQVAAAVSRDEETGRELIGIRLYSPTMDGGVHRKLVAEAREVVIEQAVLESEVQFSSVDFDIRVISLPSHAIPIRKAWALGHASRV